MTKVEEVIITDLKTRGNQLDRLNPARRVIEIYKKDGELLATYDKLGNFSVEDMIAFGNFCMMNPQLSVNESYQEWYMDYVSRF